MHKSKLLFALILLALAATERAQAENATPSPVPEEAKVSVQVPETENPDEEAEHIRTARMAELLDRATYADPEDIFRQSLLEKSAAGCKYASSISARPPHMRVALTFDDGPSPSNTPYVLEVLQKYNVPATFFVKGNNASAYRGVLDREARADNVIIGNHSWSHPDFHTLSASSQAKQLISTDNVLGSLQHPRYFRYPYGNSTCATNELAHARGYRIVGWHVDSCDWAFNKTGSVSAKDARICEVSSRNVRNFRGHVVEQLLEHRGGILLMHDIQPNTIHQLDQLIAELLHAGFTFGSLDEPGFQASLK